MKATAAYALAFSLVSGAFAAPKLVQRDAGFEDGQPISEDGKGGPILGKPHVLHLRAQYL
jgi:oxalate decarboxylase